MYSLRHIESKIREYGLGLRQTKNEQLRYLKRYEFAPVAAKGEYAVAKANEQNVTPAGKPQVTASLH